MSNRFPGPSNFNQNSRLNEGRPRQPFVQEKQPSGWNRLDQSNNNNGWRNESNSTVNKQANWNESFQQNDWSQRRDQNQNFENRNFRIEPKIKAKDFKDLQFRVDALEKCIAMIIPDKQSWQEYVKVLDSEQAKRKMSDFKRFCFNEKFREKTDKSKIENHPEFVRMQKEKQALEKEVLKMRESKPVLEISRVETSTKIVENISEEPLVIAEDDDEMTDIKELEKTIESSQDITPRVVVEPKELVEQLAKTTAELQVLQAEKSDRELTERMTNLKRSLTQKVKGLVGKKKQEKEAELERLKKGGLEFFKANYGESAPLESTSW